MGRGRRSIGTMATFVSLVVLVGCGGGSGGGSSKDSVLSGIDSIAAADRLTTTLQLKTTPAELQALGQATGSTVDPSTASAIAGASIVIENAKGDHGTDLDIRGIDGGRTLVELRSVGDSLYIHGDVRGILALLHKQSVYANLRAQTKSMPSFVQAVIGGQWVSLPGSALSSLAALTGGGASSAPGSGPRMLHDLRQAIDRHVTITESGSDSRGDHYVLHADARALAADLRNSVSAALPGGSAIGQRVPNNIAHKTIRVDAWVKDGALSQLSIDVLQFTGSAKLPAGTTLPLSITFDRSGDDIAAPSGATPVDLTQLGTLFGALTGGG